MEDLIYQIDECKAEKRKKKRNVVPDGRGMSHDVRVYLSACVCVLSVCGPKHPRPLTGLVCLSVGKANSDLLQKTQPQCHKN